MDSAALWIRPVVWGVLLVVSLLPRAASAQPQGNTEPSPDLLWSKLRHEAFTNRSTQSQLNQARELFASGSYAVAFKNLHHPRGIFGDPQALLGDRRDLSMPPADSFFWDGRRLRSVRRETIRLFESMPVAAQRTYEKQWGPVAQSALNVAFRDRSLPALMEVGRRCFATNAGARALDLAATQLLDQGQAALAAEIWQQLMDSPLHSRRLYSGQFRKAALAWLISGEPERAEEVVVRGRERGYSFALADIREAANLQAADEGATASGKWQLPFGNPANNSIASGTLPYLEPLWTQTLAAHGEFSALTNWEQTHVRNELDVIGASVWPIIASDQLVTRDLDGIRGCDLQTGRVLWRFDGTMSARQLARQLRDTGFASSLNRAVEYAWTHAPGLGCVASDGGRVFAIDWMSLEREQRSNSRQSVHHFGTNRLVCLTIPDSPSSKNAAGAPQIVEPLWATGGTLSNPDNDLLGEHLFLGPPLPMADAIFVITESLNDQELNLVKLEAATGRVIWIQKLGLVESRIFDPTQRHRFSPMCVPAASGNVIVCPTEARYYVAVDATTGELLWMYDYSNRVVNYRSWSRGLSREQGFGGLADPPHIQDDSLILLPRRSDHLHCVDLTTGDRVWQVRRNDDLYVGAVTKTVVALVSRGGMRGLSLRDGKELWSTRLGLPSGRGARTALQSPSDPQAKPRDTYLVPLKRGSVIAVDLETGDVITSTTAPSIQDRRFAREHSGDERFESLRDIDMQSFGLGSERASNETRPGNLLFHNGLAVSVGPRHLTVFAQVGDLLATLRADVNAADPASLVHLARVELAAGDITSAQQRLTQALKSRSRAGEQARWLLQEVLRDQLARPDDAVTPARRQRMIQDLAGLARSPGETEQALIQLASWELAHGSPARAVPQVASIAALRQNSFVSLDPYSERVVTSEAWGRGLIQTALARVSREERLAVIQQIEQHRQRALEADTIDSLNLFVSVYATTPESGPVRNRLADRLIQQGHFQSAELLLLQNQKAQSPEVRAVADVLLTCLWDRLGVHVEAGQTLRRISVEHADVSLAAIERDRLASVHSSLSRPLAATDGREFLNAFARSSLSWKVFEDLQPLSWPVHIARIQNTALAGSNLDAPEAWRKAPRRVDTSPAVGFDIVRTGGDLTEPHRWVMIDRLSGASRGRLEMPEQSPLPPSRYRYVGHLMPVGGRKDMRAISLLESGSRVESVDGTPYWKHRFRPVETTVNDSIEPAVATPSLFVFQTVKHLIGVDPRSGRILWRRSDLDLESGVRVDREAGLFGDGNALTLFHNDGETYSILSAQTGQTLRTGQADVDFRYPKRVFGHKLFHVTNEIRVDDEHTTRRIRVWNPTTDRLEFDQPIVGRLNFAASKNGAEMALLIGQTLQVFRMPAMERIAHVEFESEDLARFTTLRMFSDEQHVYLNLQERTTGTAFGNRNYYLAGESSIPLDNVFKGSLMAISRSSGRVLWKRSIQPRSVLNVTQASLPFLMGLSRISPRGNNARRALELELIDRETGLTIGHADRLIPDRIVHAKVDRQRGHLTLHGLTSRIDLDFSRATQSLLLEPGPL